MPLSDSKIYNKIISLIALKCKFLKPADFRKLLISKDFVLPDFEKFQELSFEAGNSCVFLQIALRDRRAIEECEASLRKWNDQGIDLVIFGDENYPSQMMTMHDAPIVIFYKGEISNINNHDSFLSVVGSRKADSFGVSLAEDISTTAADLGVCIVSGLAYGVDAAAHKGSLKCTSYFPTIAVLGNGLENIYPARHTKLAQEILEKGGIVMSQFEPGTPPYPANFLNRNRIIAALSSAILVIQAPAKSGSLSTARHGLEEGRDILVLPGAVNDPRYEGSNQLIKSGAHLITCADDVLDFYPDLLPKKRFNENITSSNHSPQHKALINELKLQPQIHVEVLQSKLSNLSNLSGLLLDLELEGILQRLPGNFITLRTTGKSSVFSDS